MPLFGYSKQALQEAEEQGFQRGKQYVMQQFWITLRQLPRDIGFEFDLTTPEAITEQVRELINNLVHTRSTLSWAQYDADRFERWGKKLQEQLKRIQAGELDRRIADLETKCDALSTTLAVCRQEARAQADDYERQLQKLQWIPVLHTNLSKISMNTNNSLIFAWDVQKKS